jgi:hypothetical protein
MANYEEFINFINTKKTSTNRLLSIINNKINDIKTINTLISSNKYDELNSFSSEIIGVIENNQSFLNEIKNNIQEFENIMHEILLRSVVYNTELNKNKLKYGLQGQLKQQLRANPPENIDELAETVVNEPIIPTPFNSSDSTGGKKFRKHKRSRKTKRLNNQKAK